MDADHQTLKLFSVTFLTFLMTLALVSLIGLPGAAAQAKPSGQSASEAATKQRPVTKNPTFGGSINFQGYGWAVADGFTSSSRLRLIRGWIFLEGNDCVTVRGYSPHSTMETHYDYGDPTNPPIIKGTLLEVTIDCPAGVRELKLYGRVGGYLTLRSHLARPATFEFVAKINKPSVIDPTVPEQPPFLPAGGWFLLDPQSGTRLSTSDQYRCGSWQGQPAYCGPFSMSQPSWRTRFSIGCRTLIIFSRSGLGAYAYNHNSVPYEPRNDCRQGEG